MSAAREWSRQANASQSHRWSPEGFCGLKRRHAESLGVPQVFARCLGGLDVESPGLASLATSGAVWWAIGGGADSRVPDPGASWLPERSIMLAVMLAVLRLIMLHAIHANISTPMAAKLSSGACAPPNAIARPTNTPGKMCIGAHTSADKMLAT